MLSAEEQQKREREVSLFLERYDWLDAALVKTGMPPTSPWWRETIERFYRSCKRQLVERVGRRGGKSTTHCRIAVLEALSGGHYVPPGDIGVVAIVSVSRSEANERLRTIKAILDRINIKYRPIDGGIEAQIPIVLVNEKGEKRKVTRPTAFKVFAASIAGVSGFTSICVICDEVAKWRDSDSGANPAKEVLASIRPTMATQPNAKIFLSSSPLSVLDAHHEAFVAGETAHQSVAFAESWVANPSLTEEATRADEPNLRLWLREYAAVPAHAVNGAFDAEDIDRAFKARGDLDDLLHATKVMIIDPSGGRGDAFTWGLLGYVHDERDKFKKRGDGTFVRWEWGAPVQRDDWDPSKAKRPFLALTQIGAEEGKFGNSDSVIDRICEEAKRAGVKQVYGDQYLAMLLEAEFRKRGLRYTSIPYSNPRKQVAVDMLRKFLAEGSISLPATPATEAAKLKKELLTYEERFTAAGTITYGGKGKEHDDRVSLLITGLMVEAEFGLPRSPHRPAIARGVGQKPILNF